MPYIAKTPDKRGNQKPISFDAIIDAYTGSEDLRTELKEHLKISKYKTKNSKKQKEVIEFCKCIITDFLREESKKLKKCKVLRL